MASFKTVLFVSMVTVCMLIGLTTATSSTTPASSSASSSAGPSTAVTTPENSAVTCAVSLLSMTIAAFSAIFLRS